MKISKWAIDKSQITVLLAFFVLVIGFMGTILIPKELNPEISEPVVNVRVEYIGASPIELENEVVRKIEEYTRNIDGIKKINAYCVNSFANMSITFHENIDVNKAKMEVRSGVNDAIPHMPTGIETPVISTKDTSDDPVMIIAISGKTKDYVTLRDIAEQAKISLENINGVSKVNVVGGYEREIRIKIDPHKMSMHKISLLSLVDYLKNMNVNYPGGKLKIRSKNYFMRITGRFKDCRELKNTIIAVKTPSEIGRARPKIIRLSDVADVSFGIEDDYSITRVGGHKGILLQIVKKKRVGTLVVSKKVKSKLDEIYKKMLKKEGLNFKVLFDQSVFVLNDNRELRDNLWQGIVAIFLILWLGMGFRAALIAAMGMPFCVILTIGALYFSGNTLNGLTQFGLIIVMGMIVDGAIVMIEAIHFNQEGGQDAKVATLSSLSDVGTSILSSVLTTMAAFAPLLFMGGLLGKYMAEIPKSVLIALFASIIFDHMVIPVAAAKYMRPRVKKTKKKKTSIGLYSWLIEWANRKRGWVVFLTAVAFALGIYGFILLPKELFPLSDTGQINIDIELSPISSVLETDKVVRRIEKGILEKYAKKGIIKSYVSIVGGEAGSSSGRNISYERSAKILIEMVDCQKRKDFSSTRLQGLIRNFASNIAGARVEVNVPYAGIGMGEPVNVLIKGDDIRVLKTISKEIQTLIRKKVKGAVNLKDNYGIGLPEISARVNREMAGLHGISIKDIAQALSVYYNGLEITKYFLGNKELKVRMKINKERAESINDLFKIYIYKSSSAGMLHLSQLVDIKVQSALGLIARENMQRSLLITGKVSGRSSVDVMADVMRELKGFALPAGYTITYTGESEEMDEGFRNLGFAFIGGLILMYIIIVIQLKSFLQPLSILITILLSIPGVVFGLLISASKVGFMAMFGIVSLSGIVVNDAIVLVTTINMRREEGASRIEAILVASKTRIRPILLTTFTTIAGLTPLAFAFGGEFSKHWIPMSWAVIGGLLFATFQTLIVVPVVYSLLEDAKVFLKRRINIKKV